MYQKFFSKRLSLLQAYLYFFLACSLLLRIFFLSYNFKEVDTSVIHLIATFLVGFLFDIGTFSFFAIPYLIYLLLIPKKLHGSLLDRIITYSGLSLGLAIFLFSFFAEITFWEEFERRFNFIAVDYLIYTYEVVKNINESYPIPLLLSAIVLLILGILYLFNKKQVFFNTFHNKTSYKSKLIPTLVFVIIACIFGGFITNKNAEQFSNRYNNEIAKTGIYSFFAAFKNNELPYNDFYKTIDQNKAIGILKNQLKTPKSEFVSNDNNEILRAIENADSISTAKHPNIIFICIESLSGKFLNALGSNLNITPTLDSLAQNSLFFSNLYATGTRTVRGIEAITLSIPPTPGRSIVKRKENQSLFTIGEILNHEGYERNFFYGGDGYFDNMNTYFGGNGFNIIDRGRGFLMDTRIKTKRINIDDSEVTFENAWGVCDTDVYSKVLKEADKAQNSNKPFFDFIMTTSNHRPYTYPEGKIDIPSGTGRHGAVKYTDYAINEFLKEAKTKPWFNNTVFVIMADHCASSAGRWVLDVENYHIPALIFNYNIRPNKVNKLCSQIDIFPTLFSQLHWNYTSNLFGTNILETKPENERALIGNYRKLGLLKADNLMVLNEQRQAEQYKWNKTDNSLTEVATDSTLLNETISFYQTADYLYHHNGLKLKQ